MEHGVTMEHRVFRKNKQKNMPAVSLFSIFACTWFLLSSNSALYIEIKLTIAHNVSISQKRNFTFLVYEFTRVLTAMALTNRYK